MVTWSPPRRRVAPARPHAVLHAARPRRVVTTPAPAAGARHPGPPLGPHPGPSPPVTAAPPVADHPPAASDHRGLAAVATLGTPALWAAAMAQAPPGTARGLVLAAGWVGIACVLDRPRRSRRRE